MLPRIKISFENGALGQVSISADGVYGLLCTGVVVASTFALSTPYILRSADTLVTLGITEANNPSIYKIVTDFYNEAGAGVELWIMAFPDTVKMSEMVSPIDATKGRALIDAANGKLKGLFVTRKPGVGYTPTITAGLDADVALAKANAQLLAQWAIDTKYAPVFSVIEGYAYSGNPIELADLLQGSDRWVSVMLGDTVVNSPSAAIGLIAGRLAKNPIHINIGRVRDGALKTLTAFLKDKAIEVADVASVHDKGYITMRTHVNRSGYFFTDDPTATLATDDYNHLTAVRTIQKAFRLAYDTMLEELLDFVEVNVDGTMQAPMIKSIQSKVENSVGLAMKGELSVDRTNPADKGVQCFIDPSQNIVSTSKWSASIKVRPFGYSRYIDIPLGFQAVVQ